MRSIELSQKNPYYIPKERYYELKHFCFQYNDWLKALAVLNGWSTSNDIWLAGIVKNNCPASQTERIAIARSYYAKRIELISKCLEEIQPAIAPFIIKGVTDGLSYDILAAQGCPCCREYYYGEYRKFFWQLSIERN